MTIKFIKADFTKKWLIPNEKGDLMAVDFEMKETPKLVCEKQNIAPEWFNLFAASDLMYKTLTQQFEALEELIVVGETVASSDNPLIKNLIELQNAILEVRQIARDGFKPIDKNNKPS